MSSRLRSLAVPACFTLVVGALLIALGVWQLHRLAWKEGLIAQIEARSRGVPVPIPPPSAWSKLDAKDYEYRHVALDGTYRNEDERLVFRGSAEGPGYLVMTPLALAGGGTVIVNRGFVPDALKAGATRKSGERTGPVHVTGLMRAPESRNLFTPADAPERGQFFSRDPDVIASDLGLKDAAPFIVDVDATPGSRDWPHGGATELAIPNNHFSYALTWFGLALGLFGVFGSFAWRRLSEPRPESPSRAAEHSGIELG